MPIGSTVIYNAGDLILSTVSSSGNAFQENKIAATTNSIILFDSNGRISSQSLNITTTGTASSLIVANNYQINNLNANQIIANSITGSFSGSVFSSSNAFVNNILTVNGTIVANSFSSSTIYVTASSLIVGDNIVTLNAATPYLRYAGIEMFDSGSQTLTSLLWDSQNKYMFVSSSELATSRQIILGPLNEANLTPNFIPLISGSNNITTSIIYQTQKNVGIGTTNPVNLLDVAGNISCSVITASLFSGSMSGSTFGTSSWSTNSLTASSLIAANSYLITNLTASSNISSSRTGSFGRINIGSVTTSSYAVNAHGLGIGLDLSNNTGTGRIGVLSVKASSSASPFSDVVSIQNSRVANQYNLIFGQTSGQSVFIGAGESAGNATSLAGWGDESLYLAADDSIKVVTNVQGGAAGCFYPVAVAPSGSVRIQYALSGSQYTAPSILYALQVSGSNTQGLLYVQSAAAPNALFVSGSGNIGIGTSNPLNRLDVAGNISCSVVTASVFSGSLTGSTFGTASWAQSASFVSTTSNAFVQNGNSFGETALFGTNDSNNLQLETNAIVRMTIGSGGQIATGTSTAIDGRYRMLLTDIHSGSRGSGSLSVFTTQRQNLSPALSTIDNGIYNRYDIAAVTQSNSVNNIASYNHIIFNTSASFSGSYESQRNEVRFVQSAAFPSNANIVNTRLNNTFASGITASVQSIYTGPLVGISEDTNNTISGSFTNIYAFAANTPFSSTTGDGISITNAYGLYLFSQKGNPVINSYGIFQAGSNDYNQFSGFSTFGTSTTQTNNRLACSGRVAIGSTYFSIAGPTNGLIVQGNTGIGTSNPVNRLDVAGNISCSIVTGSFAAISSSNYAYTSSMPNGTFAIIEDNNVAFFYYKTQNGTLRSASLN